MQINRVNNNKTFGMALARDFFKVWDKPKGPLGESCEVILHRLAKTTPQHFITRVNNFAESFWVAAPKLGTNAKKIKVGESFFAPTQYDSLVKLDEALELEYRRLAGLSKKRK